MVSLYLAHRWYQVLDNVRGVESHYVTWWSWFAAYVASRSMLGAECAWSPKV